MEKKKTIDDFFKPRNESATKSKSNSNVSTPAIKATSAGKRKATDEDPIDSKKKAKKIENNSKTIDDIDLKEEELKSETGGKTSATNKISLVSNVNLNISN